MSPEWATAIAALGTLAVITASAIAALIQLRHMRGSNQIVAINEARETLESPEFRHAYEFILRELPKRLTDPNEFPALTSYPLVGDYEAIRVVANVFETMGIFVKRGIIDGNLACDSWAFAITQTWLSLAPLTAYSREALGVPQLWENFEYLAVLSEDYMRTHPSSYPTGVRRMVRDTSFIDAVRSTETKDDRLDI